MDDVNAVCPQVEEVSYTPIVATLKMWTTKADGRKRLVYEVESSEISHIPRSYTHGSQVFIFKDYYTIENGDLICSYNKIGKCSKYHKKSKSLPSFPPQPFDHWCDRCYTKAPLIEKSRKCSRGEKKKAIERQQLEIERKQKIRATALAKKAQKKEAKNGKPDTQKASISAIQDTNIFDEEFPND